MQERQQRVPFTRPVFIAPIGGAGRAHRLLAGNISEGGMFVRSDARFDPGTPVSVSLEAKGQVFPFARGEVIWESDPAQWPHAGLLPGFGVKFTGFLNEGAPALLSHLVHRKPGENVSERLSTQLDPPRIAEQEAPPLDFMNQPLDELANAEPEVEWPIEIGVRAQPAPRTEDDQEEIEPEIATGRPSFRLDLEAERGEAAPERTAQLSPETGKRVAIAAAIGVGVLVVAAVLLMRMRANAPDLDTALAEAPASEVAEAAPAPVPEQQQFPVLDIAAPPPVQAPEPEPVAPRPSEAPVPRVALPTPPPPTAKKSAPVPVAARTGSLALSSGAVSGVKTRREGKSLDVTLSLGSGARIERAFALASPARVVFDISGERPRSSLRRDADLPGVKGVRVGARDGGTRVVLDLERGAASVEKTRTGARIQLK